MLPSLKDAASGPEHLQLLDSATSKADRFLRTPPRAPALPSPRASGRPNSVACCLEPAHNTQKYVLQDLTTRILQSKESVAVQRRPCQTLCSLHRKQHHSSRLAFHSDPSAAAPAHSCRKPCGQRSSRTRRALAGTDPFPPSPALRPEWPPITNRGLVGVKLHYVYVLSESRGGKAGEAVPPASLREEEAVPSRACPAKTKKADGWRIKLRCICMTASWRSFRG